MKNDISPRGSNYYQFKMNYLNQYKSFINSQYISEGFRITGGVILPTLVSGYFGNTATGIVMSIGALMISVSDSSGPVHHRRNGMVVCLVFVFVLALITGFINQSPIVLAIYLIVCCFFFSMMTVYGARAGTIGTASMIIITLTIDPQRHLASAYNILLHAAYIAAGGFWYMCYSLALYNFRPYRLAQQALGDCMQATAAYLGLRSALYNKDPDYDQLYSRILQQQSLVQQKQNDLSELLFKSRKITKDSTVTGRTLLMMFLDLTDIFEKIMASHQQYALLHKYFDDIDLLTDYHRMASMLSDDLYSLGLSVKSGHAATPLTNIFTEIQATYARLDELRHHYLNPGNLDGFFSLRKILDNIKDIADRIKILQQYSTYDEKYSNKYPGIDVQKFITSQPVSLSILFSNLSFKSDTFRHATRLSAAVLLGFFLSQVFTIGHSYWVLLTIVVILKPAYSLTKKRNGQRLAGTIAGIGLGVLLLHFTSNHSALLILIIFLMLCSYSTMRLNYFVSVLFMTMYLVIFYRLLNPADFSSLLRDRAIDTLTGSAIAFAASYILFPSWEKDKVRTAMITMLHEIKNYFELITNTIKGTETSNANQQLARKKMLVALANLSDSLTRMLSEPEHRQKGTQMLHRFVVLSNTLTSYLAGFFHYIKQSHNISDDELLYAIAEAVAYIDNAIQNLDAANSQIASVANQQYLRRLNEKADRLLNLRKKELETGWADTETRQSLIKIKPVADQLTLVYNVAADIDKAANAYLQSA